MMEYMGIYVFKRGVPKKRNFLIRRKRMEFKFRKMQTANYFKNLWNDLKFSKLFQNFCTKSGNSAKWSLKSLNTCKKWKIILLLSISDLVGEYVFSCYNRNCTERLNIYLSYNDRAENYTTGHIILWLKKI